MTIEGPEGEVWIMMGQKVLMYISKYGSLYMSGDVVAFGNIPPPPAPVLVPTPQSASTPTVQSVL